MRAWQAQHPCQSRSPLERDCTLVGVSYYTGTVDQVVRSILSAATCQVSFSLVVFVGTVAGGSGCIFQCNAAPCKLERTLRLLERHYRWWEDLCRVVSLHMSASRFPAYRAAHLHRPSPCATAPAADGGMRPTPTISSFPYLRNFADKWLCWMTHMLLGTDALPSSCAWWCADALGHSCGQM